ncbi:MAG: CRISPR-associated helicase Cas3', partial [Saprospiraceae bacterium]
TEASLLWASKQNKTEKIIPLLPTRVTSNSIYDRLKGYFGQKQTSVIHSSAFFYRKQKDDNFHKGLYLVDKTFFRNVNICTIDQVLTQGFNIGYWELKTFHCLNARFIIDEIHLYAPYTLGLIISTIKYLKKEFNAKFFIMTATMPKKLQLLLKETLVINENSIVKDIQLLDKRRNTFITKNCLIDDIDNDIRIELKKKRKVLIVVNTVNEAIRIYNKYKSEVEEAICYHSRFIQKDRIRKEKEILKKEKECKSMLLVATQVVEVCLDIDFDILFTENAPIDAIIQRAGRVNRKRGKKETRVIVFKEQAVTREVIYTDVEGVLENTFRLLSNLENPKLSESELIELVDEVYKNYDVDKHPSYKNGLEVYHEIQRNNHYVKDVTVDETIFTREGLDSINVIPDKFHKYLSDKEIMEKTEHELSIRIGYFNQFKSEKTDETHTWFNYVSAEYNDEIGLDLSKKKAKTVVPTSGFF